MKNIVIIGGSDAGISAALRIREFAPEIRPIMIVDDNYPNFSICGLPYYISKEVARWENLAHRTRQDIEAQGIDLWLEHTANTIHPQSKKVIVVDQTGTEKSLDYDKLIIATGAVSIKPNIPGIDLPGVFFLRWLPESVAIDEFIDKHHPKSARTPMSALIIGAGYIGMEMAEALTKRGLKVTIAEFAESVMPSFDTDFGVKITDILSQQGIQVKNNVLIESIHQVANRLEVKGSNGFEVLTDMVLVAVGSAPNIKLGQSIGVKTGLKGAFQVSRKMETNIPDVYAAGDCVETWHRILGKYTVVKHPI